MTRYRVIYFNVERNDCWTGRAERDWAGTLLAVRRALLASQRSSICSRPVGVERVS